MAPKPPNSCSVTDNSFEQYLEDLGAQTIPEPPDHLCNPDAVTTQSCATEFHVSSEENEFVAATSPRVSHPYFENQRTIGAVGCRAPGHYALYPGFAAMIEKGGLSDIEINKLYEINDYINYARELLIARAGGDAKEIAKIEKEMNDLFKGVIANQLMYSKGWLELLDGDIRKIDVAYTSSTFFPETYLALRDLYEHGNNSILFANNRMSGSSLSNELKYVGAALFNSKKVGIPRDDLLQFANELPFVGLHLILGLNNTENNAYNNFYLFLSNSQEIKKFIKETGLTDLALRVPSIVDVVANLGRLNELMVSVGREDLINLIETGGFEQILDPEAEKGFLEIRRRYFELAGDSKEARQGWKFYHGHLPDPIFFSAEFKEEFMQIVDENAAAVRSGKLLLAGMLDSLDFASLWFQGIDKDRDLLKRHLPIFFDIMHTVRANDEHGLAPLVAKMLLSREMFPYLPKIEEIIENILDNSIHNEKEEAGMITILIEAIYNIDTGGSIDGRVRGVRTDLLQKRSDALLLLSEYFSFDFVRRTAIFDVLRALGELPDSVIEDKMDALKDICGANHLERQAEIFNLIRGLKDPSVIDIIADNPRASLQSMGMIEYLKMIGHPDIESVLEKSVELSDFTTDYRDGTSLLTFDPEKCETYDFLYQSLARAGLGAMGFDLVRSLDMTNFFKTLATKDEVTAVEIIDEVGRKGSMWIAERLRMEFLKGRLERPGWLRKYLEREGWFNKETGMINVTQNNIKEINGLMKLLIYVVERNLSFDVVQDLNGIFQLPTAENLTNPYAVNWLADKFDVEEINFKARSDLHFLGQYFMLRNNLQRLSNEPGERYLKNSFREIDLNAIVFGDGTVKGIDVFDIGQLEAWRIDINKSAESRTGDQLIDGIGSAYLESKPADYKNIKELLRFADSWGTPKVEERDVIGLYQQFSGFALAEIADFLKREMEGFGKARVKESLANYGISYDALKSELEGRGYFIEKDGSISKTWNRFWNGHASYVVRKGAQSITAGDGIEFDAGSVKVETTSWTPRNGVNVYDLKVEGREQAKVIHCDPTKTKVVIAAERSGVVDMADVEKKYGRRYIFSAPVSMTTGNRKLTQIAFNEGIQINYLLTVGSFDGLIIVDSNGGQKVLNKQGIRLSELVSEEDLSNPAIKGSFERWCIKNGCKGSDGKIDFRKALDSLIRPANKIGDRRLFFDILKTKKMGLLSNLLLVDGDKTDHLNDGADSRRLYLEFSDGSFGIIDSTVNMSSNNAVDLARAYAKNRGLTLTGAVYMDTGMYDMANFVDGGGNKHVLGWEDTDNSSNRLIIVSRE